MIEFCESQGQDMSKLRGTLNLQDSGMRIYKVYIQTLIVIIPFKSLLYLGERRS